MLNAGSAKLNASTKQLADIKHEKEKIEKKLRKLEQMVVDKKRTAGSGMPQPTSEPAAKKRKLHWQNDFVKGTQAHLMLQWVDAPAHVSLTYLCFDTANTVESK